MDIEHLYANVGKPVRFRPDATKEGAYREMAFEVTGVQLDWANVPAYRVRCTDYEDTFGRVMPVADAVFV